MLVILRTCANGRVWMGALASLAWTAEAAVATWSLVCLGQSFWGYSLVAAVHLIREMS